MAVTEESANYFECMDCGNGIDVPDGATRAECGKCKAFYAIGDDFTWQISGKYTTIEEGKIDPDAVIKTIKEHQKKHPEN